MEKMINNIIILLENVRNAWQNVSEKGIEKRRPGKRKLRWERFKWRLAGAGLIVVTMPVVKVLEGDATIALLTVPLGAYMMLGREIGGE